MTPEEQREAVDIHKATMADWIAAGVAFIVIWIPTAMLLDVLFGDDHSQHSRVGALILAAPLAAFLAHRWARS
jgi:hypothetical protein